MWMLRIQRIFKHSKKCIMDWDTAQNANKATEKLYYRFQK